MSRFHPPVQTSFVARLERIAQERATRFAANKRRRKVFMWRNVLYPLSFLWLFLLGAAGGSFSRAFQFHILGIDPRMTATMQQFLIDSIVAAVTMYVLHVLINRPTKHHATFLMVGVWGITLTFHNLAHWFPSIMSTLFSDVWVYHTRKVSEPETIAFLGSYLAF